MSMNHERIGLTSQLLIPAADKFENVPYKIRYLGSAGFPDPVAEKNNVQVFLINAKDVKDIPGAVEEDKQLILQALQKAEDTKESKGTLEQQLAFVEGLQDMLENPVYNKSPSSEMLEKIGTDIRMRHIKSDQVRYTSAISHVF